MLLEKHKLPAPFEPDTNWEKMEKSNRPKEMQVTSYKDKAWEQW